MSKALPDVLSWSIRDSGDLKSRGADLPYRRQNAWQTERDHELRQNGFAQLLEFVPFSHFEHLVDVYQTNKGVSSFSA